MDDDDFDSEDDYHPVFEPEDDCDCQWCLAERGETEYDRQQSASKCYVCSTRAVHLHMLTEQYLCDCKAAECLARNEPVLMATQQVMVERDIYMFPVQPAPLLAAA